MSRKASQHGSRVIEVRKGFGVVNSRWDEELPIASAIAGDEDSLAMVWVSVRRWVAAILIAHKPREADLEDLLQLVALQVCKKVGEVRDPSLFKPWLRTVTINIAREQGRKTTRRKSGMLRLVGRLRTEEKQDRESGRMWISEEAQRVLDAAMALPEKYREPVLMRCQQSMSYKQIAEILALPETTIETRIARGRRMLREELAKSSDGSSGIKTTGEERTGVVRAGGAS